MAVSFNKFNAFALDLGLQKHKFGTDQLAIALTDTLPVAANAVIADISQISYTNLSSRNVTTTSWTQSSGTAKLILADLTLTASGNVAQYRYLVLYNATTSGNPLIGWYDYAAEINMVNSDTTVIDFDASAGVITIV